MAMIAIIFSILSSALIIVSIVCIYQFVIKNARRRQLISQVNTVLEKKGWFAEKLEYFETRALALASGKSKLVFIDRYGVKKSQIIDLKNFTDCFLVQKELMVQLILMSDGGTQQMTIPFYIKYMNSPMKKRGLTKSAKEWKRIISAHLTVHQNSQYVE